MAGLSSQDRASLEKAPKIGGRGPATGGYPSAEQKAFRKTVDGISGENAWMAIPALAPVVAPLLAEGAVAVGMFARRGGEIAVGKTFRAAPFGNRTGHPLGRWPHYHRSKPLPGGGSAPGQGIGRHRPWETKSPDKTIWDRF